MMLRFSICLIMGFKSSCVQFIPKRMGVIWLCFENGMRSRILINKSVVKEINT